VTNEPRRPWRTDAQWNRLRERIEGAPLVRPPKRLGPTPWLVAAATIVVVAVLGWRMTRPKSDQRTVTTAAGERIEIKLADGTVITLGPASTLRYSTDNERTVSLEGLANFNVVHDASRPFIVKAGNAVATDLGTEFVVRAYRTDSIVDVAVKSGRVALSGTSRVELDAGALGRVHADGSTTRGDTSAAVSHLAWIDGRLAFSAEPLSGVAAELSRWFNVDVRVDAALARQRITAVYNAPTLDGVLEALTGSLDVRIDRMGRVITIAPRTK
jgi:transmembrane sensor